MYYYHSSKQGDGVAASLVESSLDYLSSESLVTKKAFHRGMGIKHRGYRVIIEIEENGHEEISGYRRA